MSPNTNSSRNETVVSSEEIHVMSRQEQLIKAGLTVQEVAILMASEAKQAAKAARRDTVAKVMTRERFCTKAQPFQATLQINGEEIPVTVMVGGHNPMKSMGWNANQQMKVTVDGEVLSCTLGLNLTVNHTKPVR